MAHSCQSAIDCTRHGRRGRPALRAGACVAFALACLWCLPGTTARAQEPSVPAGPLTLDQVLQMAEARSERMAIAREGIRRAEGEQARARSGLFPQLSVSAGYDRTLASEFEGIFDNGAFDLPTDTQDGSGLRDLPFGREHIWRATLTFSQNLYSGGRLGAQAAVAAVGHDTAALGVTGARAQLLLDVTQAYYDALLGERLVAIAEATLEQAGATLGQVLAGFDAGTQPEFEVLRARVSRDSQTPHVIRQRVNREVALLRLKQLLELPADHDLRLADTLGEETLPPPAVFAERVAAVEAAIRPATPQAVTLQPDAVALPERVPVLEAAAAVRLREASLQLAQAQRMPSVTMSSSYGRVAYPSSFLWGFGGVRTNWTIGASVQMPLLTGGRQRGDEAVARAELEETRRRLRQTQDLAALDTRSAWAELLAARAVWEASAGTVQQAFRAYEIADVRYRAGISTQLELADSRLLLQQAEVNRAQAARDLQLARARVALLPDLPLGAGTPLPSPPVLVPQVPLTPSPAPASPFGTQLATGAATGAAAQTGTR
jgi:outer membrane protein